MDIYPGLVVDIYPRSYGGCIFSFLGALLLFFLVAVAVYIPINRVRGFDFLQTLSSICY